MRDHSLDAIFTWIFIETYEREASIASDVNTFSHGASIASNVDTFFATHCDAKPETVTLLQIQSTESLFRTKK